MHKMATSIPKEYRRFLSQTTGVLDRAVGKNAPRSVTTEWKRCSCDKSRCEEISDEEEAAASATKAEEDSKKGRRDDL